MRNHLYSITGVVAALTLSPLIHAAELTLNWADPKEYRDIDAGNSLQSRFNDRVMRELGESFSKAAAKLPATYKIAIDINDVDLAGDTRLHTGSMHDIRIVKDIYPPMIKLNLSITDDSGKIVIDNEENRLLDMSFMMRSNAFSDSDPLRYERSMIERWMAERFKDLP